MSFIQKIRVYLFYLSESDSPKFLSDSRTPWLYQRFFTSFVCCPHWKEWFFPSTISSPTLFLQTTIPRKSNSAQNYLVTITPVLRAQIKWFLSLNWISKWDLSPHFGITSFGALLLELLPFLYFFPVTIAFCFLDTVFFFLHFNLVQLFTFSTNFTTFLTVYIYILQWLLWFEIFVFVNDFGLINCMNLVNCDVRSRALNKNVVIRREKTWIRDTWVKLLVCLTDKL